ncbi:MAG: hypothetical protein ACPG7F_15780 [Aggregatilineales bacterium]
MRTLAMAYEMAAPAYDEHGGRKPRPGKKKPGRKGKKCKKRGKRGKRR